MKLLKAKKIYLVDENFSTTNALVIEDDKILDTGDFEELKNKYPTAEIILDHENQVIYPGFIEPHTHFMGGVLPGGTVLVDVMDWEVDGKVYTATSTKEEIYERIREDIKNYPEKKCHFVMGLYEPIHGAVRAKDLDEQKFCAPVILITNSTHAWYFNKEAIDLLGGELEESIPNGTYGFATDENGKFTGTLKEVSVQLAVPTLMKYLATPEVFKRGIKMQYDSNMKKGITTIVDMAWGLGGPLDQASLDAMNNFPQRLGKVNHWIAIAKKVYDKELSKEENRKNIFEYIKKEYEKEGFDKNNKRFTAKGVKFFADGAIIDLEVINSVPDLITNETPEWNHDLRIGEKHHGLDTMKDDMDLFFSNDYMIHVHTQGDKANEIMVGMFKELQEKHGVEHNKMSLEHFSFSNDEVFKLMESENPMYISGLPHYGYYFHKSWKESGHVPGYIVDTITSFKKAIDKGATLALHSDFMNFPTDPLACLYFANKKLCRDTGVDYNDQAISMEDALKGITINAAKNHQLESEIGSIEKGKLADLTILDVDLFDIEPECLLSTDAKGIYVGGEYYKS